MILFAVDRKRLILHFLQNVDPVIWIQEGQEGDSAAEAVVPHKFKACYVGLLQLLIAQQVDVVHREPVLVKQTFQSAQSAREGRQAVVEVALAEKISDSEQSVCLQQFV